MVRLALSLAVAAAVTFAATAPAQAAGYRDPCAGSCTLGGDPKPFFGARAGLAIPPGSVGFSPQFGLEAGVAASNGLGFGVHFLSAIDPPKVDFLGDPAYGIGFSADARWYISPTPNFSIYPFLSAGFIAGPDQNTRENVVLPLINPGVGARMSLGPIYAGLDFGLASFLIPYFNLSLGWQGL